MILNLFLIGLLMVAECSEIENSTEIVIKLLGLDNSFIGHMQVKHNLTYKKSIFNDYHLFVAIDKYERKRENGTSRIDDENGTLVAEYLIMRDLQRTRRDISNEFEYFASLLKGGFNKTLLGFYQDSKQAIGEQASALCGPSRYKFNDPMWHDQWYMNDGCVEGRHLNVSGAWDQGVTGRGVVLSVIDDGIEMTNTELRENYDSNASTDFNDNDSDPQPRYDHTNENKHGTRCAGEISASANNSVCGVGVAFNSHVGGIRLLDGKINDRLEAEALVFNLNYIDIYSASWGPVDNGRIVEGPDVLARQALMKGTSDGRRGKGSIYVWASGNGGHFKDNCNCDGYAASIFTITISSCTRIHRMPLYSERCASIMATVYSSGEKTHNNIITSDLHNKCTKSHTGTSASAPIGAAIIALALEANANLTWRDIQYLIVITADHSQLQANDLQMNGMGKRVSHSFGFGLMNAGRMVELARHWKSVEMAIRCELNVFDMAILDIPSNSSRILIAHITNRSCHAGLGALEHVIAQITLKSGIRGRLAIRLTSPSGTKSELLEQRPFDHSHHGFNSWPFMSVHYWGERAFGTWTLEITNSGPLTTRLHKWTLLLHGVNFDYLLNTEI